MKVVAHVNIPEGGILEKTYNHVGQDMHISPAGVTLRNVNGALIAILPWAALALLEVPENDSNLVSLQAGIQGQLG